MRRLLSLPVLGLAAVLGAAPAAHGQAYVGFVYPAGAQQGTKVVVRMGGQRIDGIEAAMVSGRGVEARLVDYHRYLNNQEVGLMREQLRNLRRGSRRDSVRDEATRRVVARIEERMAGYTNTPANRSLANIAFVEVTVAPDAEPGPREIRLATRGGVTNPMPFFVSQYPEVARKPLGTCPLPVLGKEELAERKRPAEEVEARVSVPCVANGQVAAGEINRYRFEARKGQRLVISTEARRLVPYLADAVPGWFQPVLTLYDAQGREVAYNDDFRFKPDPVLSCEVPADGEYVLTISDALFRGREDFVYRVTIAEQPFITSVFPLGGRVGETTAVEIKGWNLDGAQPVLPPASNGPGVFSVTASKAGLVSNRVPFALDTLPEALEREPNDDCTHAQKVALPVIVNGRIGRPGDWDVFRFEGRAGETVVAEVTARRLDSPLDSVVKITDASGNLLALNDDHYDLGSGLNTHHADSYVTAELPADGTYFVHLGDVARHGGEECAYRLRISPPQADFQLYALPSGGAMRSKGFAAATVYALRKDGFAGPIKVALKDPPKGFAAAPLTLSPAQTTGRFAVNTRLVSTEGPVSLTIEGRAAVGDREIVREAVPGDDRMQAFLWRHILPAEDIKVLVFDPSHQPPPKRVAPELPPPPAKPETGDDPAAKPKFTRGQVAGRLRQLKLLYEEGLLTDDFYLEKVAECQAAL